MDKLPLLIFPDVKIEDPPKGHGFTPKKFHKPTIDRQKERIESKINIFGEIFDEKQSLLSKTLDGYEAETVLIIEVISRIDKFYNVVKNTEGLEWLAEWDEEIEPDSDFYEEEDKEKLLDGRLFLSISTKQGYHELLSLWKLWKESKPFPHGKGTWKKIFSHLKDIRPWGIQEQFLETGIIKEWEKDLEEFPDEPITFQIELFYRKSQYSRQKNEQYIQILIEKLGGQLTSNFIDMNHINFHSVKAKLPAASIKVLLQNIKSSAATDIELLNFSGIMYFRPTGQSLAKSLVEDGVLEELQIGDTSTLIEEPVIALLDGIPYIQHDLLKDRIILDDPDDFESFYQPGERKHGTSMASLILHGEIDKGEKALKRKIYCRPILHPDPISRSFGNVSEYTPNSMFLEDLIERSVRRMFEGDDSVEAQAKNIKVINLSIGDQFRPFLYSMSPLARLIDWLSWKYQVLFCVSVGNFIHDIDLDKTETDFKKLSNDEKINTTLTSIKNSIPHRRIISPAESINSIAVGAIHSDHSTVSHIGHHINILPDSNFISPINRLGYGFRKGVKPEILFSGGQQFYNFKIPSEKNCEISQFTALPGHKVANEGSVGTSNEVVYTRGTSNATALATRASSMIYEVIDKLREDSSKIQHENVAVLIKSLLVHGASWNDNFNTLKKHFSDLSKTQLKKFAHKLLGYGNTDIEKVLYCTEQRATIIGCESIKEKEVHKYFFPLPSSLSNTKEFRKMTITLAWFTPININHRYLREAKLEFTPPTKNSLLLERENFDHHIVKRGTVQHEILSSDKISDYQEGEGLAINVHCKKDATNKLTEEIPYALTVTLEVHEGVKLPIYQEIKEQIQPKVKV